MGPPGGQRHISRTGANSSLAHHQPMGVSGGLGPRASPNYSDQLYKGLEGLCCAIKQDVRYDLLLQVKPEEKPSFSLLLLCQLQPAGRGVKQVVPLQATHPSVLL